MKINFLKDLLTASVRVVIVNSRHEFCYTSRTIVRAKYPNINLWLYHTTGSHFDSIEKPQKYFRDIEKILLQILKKFKFVYNVKTFL
jgi:hypothetical protein